VSTSVLFSSLFESFLSTSCWSLYSPSSSASQILLRFFPYVFRLSSHINKQCLSCQISLLSLSQCHCMQHIILFIIFSTVYTRQLFSNCTYVFLKQLLSQSFPDSLILLSVFSSHYFLFVLFLHITFFLKPFISEQFNIVLPYFIRVVSLPHEMSVSPSQLSVSFLFCLKNPHSCPTSIYFPSWYSSVLFIFSFPFLHLPSNVSECFRNMWRYSVSLYSLECPVIQTLSVTNLSRTGLPVPPSMFLCVRISVAVTTSCTLLHDLCAGYVTYVYWIWH